MSWPFTGGRTLSLVAGVAILAHAAPARAQLVTGPPGAIRGIFGGRQPVNTGGPTQRWTLAGDAAVGEDREPIEIPGAANPLLDGRTARTGSVISRYWRGQATNFFELSGGGFVTRQSLAAQDLRGVNGGGRFLRSFGTRTGISAMLNASYQPFQILLPGPAPTATPPATGGDLPTDAGTLLGVQDQRLVSAQMRADTFRSWTPRQRLEVGAWRSQWEAVRGPAMEDFAEAVLARESWNPTEHSTVFGLYRFGRNYRNVGPGTERRARVHAAEAGWRFDQRLGPDRNVLYQVQAGVAHATGFVGSAAPGTAVQAVGSGSMQMNLGQNWSIVLRAIRDVAAVGGVSPDPFVTEQVQAQLNGIIGRRLSLFATSGYGRGVSATATAADFDGTTSVLRAQYGIASWAGVFATYTMYQHEFRGVQAVAPGFPVRYERHSFRVGVTLWAPLYGTF